jgi:hypothetical protein
LIGSIKRDKPMDEISLYDLEKLEQIMKARRIMDYSITMYYHLTLDLELMFKKLRFKEEVGKKIIY